ncbi:MAG: hypothetical protein NC548_29680 [Lachnospiraceae bacterium]|nr:hypothetical protein [Lachnospiraceae bacterium]
MATYLIKRLANGEMIDDGNNRSLFKFTNTEGDEITIVSNIGMFQPPNPLAIYAMGDAMLEFGVRLARSASVRNGKLLSDAFTEVKGLGDDENE